MATATRKPAKIVPPIELVLRRLLAQLRQLGVDASFTLVLYILMVPVLVYIVAANQQFRWP
ncbi:MAG: hypothetical protein EXR58_01675 [Chloroflexi bacterium]|nr:hypothetical protein [Chloroflexota bacterium]